MRSSIAAALIAGAHVAYALPNVGAAVPSARVVDSEDNVFDLRSVKGRPILVVYEDKDSAHVNDAFKAELGRLARTGAYRTAVALVPVADVRHYDFWPVRGFVKDAIRSESKKQGTGIYCDWKGDFARSLSLGSGTSNVVLYGRSGRVLFAKAGRLDATEVQQVIALLRSEVGPS